MLKKIIRFSVNKIPNVIYPIKKFFEYRFYPLELLPKSPDYFRIYRYFNSHPEFKRWEGGWIYKEVKYPDYLFLGGAAFAIFGKAKLLLKGKGIDVGAGFWPFPGSIAVDAFRGEGSAHTVSDFEDASLDYIFSSHCLEHISDWENELIRWQKKLRPEGLLFLYLPHPDCGIWLQGAPGIGDGHKWVPTTSMLLEFSKANGFDIEYLDEGPDAMMSFSVCLKKRK